MPTALELLRMTTVAARSPFLRPAIVTPSSGAPFGVSGVLVEPRQLWGSIGDEAGYADTSGSYVELYTPDGRSIEEFPVGTDGSYGSIQFTDSLTEYSIVGTQQEEQIIRLYLGHA